MATKTFQLKEQTFTRMANQVNAEYERLDKMSCDESNALGNECERERALRELKDALYTVKYAFSEFHHLID